MSSPSRHRQSPLYRLARALHQSDARHEKPHGEAQEADDCRDAEQLAGVAEGHGDAFVRAEGDSHGRCVAHKGCHPTPLQSLQAGEEHDKQRREELPKVFSDRDPAILVEK